jgi:uncharacterized membrane protein
VPKWTYEVEHLYQAVPPGTVDRSKVPDPGASGGIAVRGDETASFSYWHNYQVMQPGEYLAVARLKVSDNTKKDIICRLTIENGETYRDIRASEFTAPNVYQEFNVPFTLKAPVLYSTPISSSKVPGVVVWADVITVTLKHPFGDDEQLKLTGFQRRELTLPADLAGVFLGRGVYYDFYRVGEVAPFLGGALDGGAVVTGQRGASLNNFPTTYEEMVKRRVYVLADVPTGAFSAAQRAMLEDFVKAGGGLVVLGGPYSFGPGEYASSDVFARLLPVVLNGRYDVVKCAPPVVLKAPANSLVADLLGKDAPTVVYRHKLAAKPGATVHLTAGDAPLVVTGAYGKGRVVAILATPLGDAPTPWWKWPTWPTLMLRLLAWAAGQ